MIVTAHFNAIPVTILNRLVAAKVSKEWPELAKRTSQSRRLSLDRTNNQFFAATPNLDSDISSSKR